jgi:5-methylcytosine-specific restriction endonuclease McrA
MSAPTIPQLSLFPTRTCECGCGAPLRPGKRFLSGHNFRTMPRTPAHKANIGAAQKRAWDSGKRQRVVQGEIRQRNGRLYTRVRSSKGWWYWKWLPAEEPERDWDTLSSSVRAYWRKKGLPVPKKRGGVARGYKQTPSHVEARRKAQRRSLLDLTAFSRAERHRIRKTLEYRHWRRAVFQRDAYTCQRCGAKNGQGKTVLLEAHHLKSFTRHPRLRFDVNNGQTLCRACHRLISARHMRGNKNGAKKRGPVS